MEEIDIIELLKRVKEGNVPKRIEINGSVYNYEGWNGSNIQFMYENNNYNMFSENIGFDTKIKILDKPIIEELDYKLEEIEANYNESWLMNCIRANKDKINEIIKIINKENKDE